jgi:hypothetical protein
MKGVRAWFSNRRRGSLNWVKNREQSRPGGLAPLLQRSDLPENLSRIKSPGGMPD